MMAKHWQFDPANRLSSRKCHGSLKPFCDFFFFYHYLSAFLALTVFYMIHMTVDTHEEYKTWWFLKKGKKGKVNEQPISSKMTKPDFLVSRFSSKVPFWLIPFFSRKAIGLKFNLARHSVLRGLNIWKKYIFIYTPYIYACQCTQLSVLTIYCLYETFEAINMGAVTCLASKGADLCCNPEPDLTT